MFLAVLELVRQRRIGAEQQADFKDVRLFLRDPAAEPAAPRTPRGAKESREALGRKGPRRPSARQVENLRDMMDDVELEKTEFDQILESIHVPEVETFRPLYSEDELLGRKEPDAANAAPQTPGAGEAAPAGSPPSDAPADGGDQGGIDQAQPAPPAPPADDGG
jgi:hypothetical protein